MREISNSPSPRPVNGQRIRIMQVIDSLEMGGAERVAVNLANLLPREIFQSYLCVTRHGGPLARQVGSHVALVPLNRRGRFDVAALYRMAAYCAREEIQLLHAHGSSIFLARISALLSNSPAAVWHDHYGRCELGGRPPWLYRIATRGAGVIAVNRPLLEWSRTKLAVPEDRSWYVPNWVEPVPAAPVAPDLPGSSGRRVVCVANFRAQKDHITLLRALARVKEVVPDVHLLLAGDATEPRYAQYVRTQIGLLQLAGNVTCLGPREDVVSILEASDVGVLSSVSEGLPLALLEYGMAGLPVVATDVGQCSEVLDQGRVGALVPRSAPHQMAEALIRLLQSPELRAHQGAAFKQHVSSRYSPDAAVRQICEIYRMMLQARKAPHAT